MKRVFSGVKPTGHLTLGNYLGAMRRWSAVDQHEADALFCIVDLHALTVDHDPGRVRRLSRQAATLLLAAGSIRSCAPSSPRVMWMSTRGCRICWSAWPRTARCGG